MDRLKNPFLNEKLHAFGRMVFPTPEGEEFGVSRVWYKAGHVYEGHCEVELANGASGLVPVEDVRVAPDWDDTPEEGRFAGSEFFRPRFLGGFTSQDRPPFQRDHGVVLPSDMGALRELAATVEPGETVHWCSHGSNEFRGRLTVTSADDRGIGFDGGWSRPSGFTWPVSSEAEIGPQYAREFRVEGRTLRLFNVPPARTGRGPVESLTLTFERKG